MKCKLVLLSAMLLLSFDIPHAADSVAVWIYDIANDVILDDPATDTIYTADADGNPLSYQVWIALEINEDMQGLSLGFRISSADGATWQYDAQPDGLGPGGPNTGLAAVTVASGSRLDPPENAFDITGLEITEKDVDGLVDDTLAFHGVGASSWLSGGALEHMISIHFTPAPVGYQEVKTFCIDSATAAPIGWSFTNVASFSYPPAIGPALCLPVASLDPNVADNERPAISYSYGLSQNYPNPFNPATTIEYNLPRTEQTTLEVYNILGHRIRTLVKGSQKAGHHVVTWDGRDNSGIQVATGIYFYRLKSGNHVTTRKMILDK